MCSLEQRLTEERKIFLGTLRLLESGINASEKWFRPSVLLLESRESSHKPNPKGICIIT